MKLTKNEISFLSHELSEKNQIGLFTNVHSVLVGTEQSTLKEKGLYKDGKLTDLSNEMLKIVAKPEKCSRLILRDNAFLIEKYAYKSNNKIVLAENDNGDMLFSSPKNFDNTIMALSEFTGMSNIKTSDIEVLLPVDEMLVLLAMVDIYRKNAMLSYWGQKTEATIKFADIRERLDEPVQNSLLKMLVNNYNYSVPKVENTKNILESLIDKNIACFTTGYALTKQYAEFGTSFLIPKTVVMLETFNVNDQNRIATAGVLCISAGLQDVVSFIFTDGEIEISSITGSYMLKIIENFLNFPNVTDG